MNWFHKLLKSIKRIFKRFVSLFKKKKPVIVSYVSKVSLLEEKIRSYMDEMKNLRGLKEFYNNDYKVNEGQIKEIDRKIAIIRQEMFAKNRELRREKAKENLKLLKERV